MMVSIAGLAARLWLTLFLLAGLDLLARGSGDDRTNRWCMYEDDGACDEGQDCNWGTGAPPRPRSHSRLRRTSS